jgi:hypothetical protein
MADPRSYPGTPRWVKISGIIGGVLALLFVIAIVSGHGPGRHGPGRHMPFGGAAGHAPASSIAVPGAPQP